MIVMFTAATIDLFEEAGTGNNNRPTLLPVRTAVGFRAYSLGFKV
jgi:hypothetical protein